MKNQNTMQSKQKEQTILRNKKLLEALNHCRLGLIAFYNFYQKPIDQLDNTAEFWYINLFNICGGDDTESAKAICDDYLETEVKKTHDRYIALLQELEERKKLELSRIFREK